MEALKELKEHKEVLKGVKITLAQAEQVISVISKPDYSTICNCIGEQATKNKNFDISRQTSTPHGPLAKELRYAMQNIV